MRLSALVAGLSLKLNDFLSLISSLARMGISLDWPGFRLSLSSLFNTVRAMTDILQLLTPQLLPLETYLAPRDYLPHDNPMIFIDELLAVTDEAIVTRTYVAPEHNLMLFKNDQGEVPSHFALEIMAQSIGAWSGYHRVMRGANPLKVGMLLSVRNFTTQEAPLVRNCVLTTVMRMLFNDGKCGTFEGTVYRRAMPDFPYSYSPLTAPQPTQVQSQAQASASAANESAQAANQVASTTPGTPGAPALQTTLPPQAESNAQVEAQPNPLLLQALGEPWAQGRLTTIEVEDQELSSLL